MKLLLAVLAVTALTQVPSAMAGCTVPDGYSGTGTIKFAFKPSPEEVLASMTGMQSPLVLMKKLQDASLAANTALNGAAKAVPFPLRSFMPQCRFYWVSNEAYCDDMNPLLVTALCKGLGGIVDTVGNSIKLPVPGSLLPVVQNKSCEADVNGHTWGQIAIKAPEAWAQGCKGAGVVVANIDSGVLWNHTELRDNMRPTYNWMDPYDNSPTPIDQNGHGTHTMGTMCGKTVGVAPSATWIACRGCNAQECADEKLTACGQWLACPDKNATGLNCSTRPDVINNSWGGGIGNTMFQSVQKVWKAMGIASFFSSGNSGSSCMSVMSPADGNWTVFGHVSVGSVDCELMTSGFSSRGPSQAADYMGGLGVQLTVPGTNVRSAWNTGVDAYNTISGTSMSSPHATGAAAVVLSKKRMSPPELYQVLTSTATQPTTVTSSNSCGCSCSTNAVWPNNAQGYGVVNLLDATNAV